MMIETITMAVVVVLAHSTIAGLCYGWLRSRNREILPLADECRHQAPACHGPNASWGFICWSCHGDHQEWLSSLKMPWWSVPASLIWPLWPLATPVVLFKRAARLSLPTPSAEET